MVPPPLWAIRNGATDGPRFDGLTTPAALPEFENMLGIVAAIARALDVLAVNVDAIFGMVTKVGKCDRNNMGGP